MSEIKCPQCGTHFTVDESDYAKIVQQVHDAEFNDAVNAAVLQKEAVLKAENKALIAEHEAKIDALKAQAQAEIAKQLGEANALRAQVKAQTEAQATEIEKVKLEFKAASAKQEAELEKARLQFREESAEIIQKKDKVLQEKEFELKLKDEQIAQREREIQDMRDMRSKLSVKLLGESLEQHCEIAFNQLRSTAFRNAEFSKDSAVVDGTKGDYVFREYTEEGAELISIMFEMKTEFDDSSSSNKKSNESHLKKLHDDRAKKHCEYAILVSTLEADSELYNQGIVDVSYLYPKMFVVRPQFFIPIISLLRNAALDNAFYKNELKLQREREIDITKFEEKLLSFQEGFGKNCEQATKRFHEAIKSIDDSIKNLELVKERLLASEKQMNSADKKLSELTIRKLTHGNPTMKEKFKALESSHLGENTTE